MPLNETIEKIISALLNIALLNIAYGFFEKNFSDMYDRFKSSHDWIIAHLGLCL